VKRFLARLLLFLLTFAVLATLTDKVTSHGLQQARTAEFGTWSDLYHGRINADLVVVGSSRAMVHVSPAILSEELNVSVYNLGHNGQHFPLQRVRFEEYRKFNKAPMWLIQTVDVTSLHDRETAFQYEQFLPWFHRADLIAAVSHYQGFEEPDRWLPMYRYRGRGELVKTGIGHALGWGNLTSERDRGYVGRDSEWDGSFEEFAKKNNDGYQSEIDKTIEDSMDEFVNQQTGDGIRYVMVFTPEYEPAQKLCRNRSDVVDRLKRIAKRNGADFIDYSDDPICKDQSLFYNSQHLNRTGAEQFSADLAKLLKELKSSKSPAAREFDAL
jgi:hypothetical protein